MGLTVIANSDVDAELESLAETPGAFVPSPSSLPLGGRSDELKKPPVGKYTISKVRKSDGEGIFVGSRGNDGVAPIAVIRMA
jgi:hypothetical protein